MITCRELADNLAEVLAEELPPERLREVDSHLEVCPPCVALLCSYRITARLARRLPPGPAATVIGNSIMSLPALVSTKAGSRSSTRGQVGVCFIAHASGGARVLGRSGPAGTTWTMR